MTARQAHIVRPTTVSKATCNGDMRSQNDHNNDYLSGATGSFNDRVQAY